MIRRPVNSTCLRSVGYDPVREVLEVEFQRGGVYQYLRVPECIYRELISASSPGRYFGNILHGAYTEVRLPLERPEPLPDQAA